MSQINPTHKAIQAYYAALRTYAEHEGALRSAFLNLLAETAKPHGWTLIPELGQKVRGKNIYPDGTLRDGNSLPRGFWEAKDTKDDLDKEVRLKIDKGYPTTNIIFEDTRQAVLYQGGREALRVDLTQPPLLADLLNQFYGYVEPHIQEFEEAVEQFKEEVPRLAHGLADKLKAAHKDNAKFQAVFADFFTLCQKSLNPNISRDAVDEMLVQHLLTERLIRKAFEAIKWVARKIAHFAKKQRWGRWQQKSLPLSRAWVRASTRTWLHLPTMHNLWIAYHDTKNLVS